MARGERISVIGPSGSGKTTLGRLLEARHGLERLELDSLQHQANWTPLDPELFRSRVGEFIAKPRWVIDGNYTSVGALDLIWSRADTVLWLDLPRWHTTLRVARRSLTRALTGEELWNGNREELRNLVSTDREVNMVLWAASNHAHVRQKYERRIHDAKWSALEVVRLRSLRQVRAWLDGAGS